MSLSKLQKDASQGDNTAMTEILNCYNRLIRKNSYIKGKFDEDHYQELNLQVIRCVKNFKYQEVQGVYDMI